MTRAAAWLFRQLPPAGRARAPAQGASVTAAQRAVLDGLIADVGAERVLRAAHELAGREYSARTVLDDTAGEELRPCSDGTPGHDLDLGGPEGGAS